MNIKNGMKPVHPGEILREEIDEIGLSANALAKALAKALSVPVTRIRRILKDKQEVSADTALRLARYFRRHRNSGLTYKRHGNFVWRK